MTWEFQLYLFILLITVGLVVVVAMLAWRRRETPGAAPLALIMLAVAVWAGLTRLGHAVVGFQNKLFFGELEYLRTSSVPPFWLIFALSNRGLNRFLTRRNLILLSICCSSRRANLFSRPLAISVRWDGEWSSASPCCTATNRWLSCACWRINRALPRLSTRRCLPVWAIKLRQQFPMRNYSGLRWTSAAVPTAAGDYEAAAHPIHWQSLPVSVRAWADRPA